MQADGGGADPQADLEELRSVLETVPLAVGLTIAQNGGFEPAAGSQAAREIAEQGPFVGRSKHPVLDAHSIALLRLSSATEHFEALVRSITDPALAYGPASLARTALENSARAWWLLDPALDTKMRIARGRTEMISNFRQVARLPLPQAQAWAAARLADVIGDSQQVGFTPRRQRRAIIGMEEAPIGATAVIAAQLDDLGRVAYSDLSSVAHGTLFGLVSRLGMVAPGENVPAVAEGVTLVTPAADLGSLINGISVALLSFRGAMDRRFGLYGWDVTHWEKWKASSGAILKRLLRFDAPGVD